MFSGLGKSQSATGGGLFGSSSQPAQSGDLFGGTQQNTQLGGGLFGGGNQQNTQPSAGLFGGGNQQQSNQSGGGLFGGSTTQNNQPSGGLFGGGNQSTNQPGGLFTNTSTTQPAQRSGGLFGGTPQPSYPLGPQNQNQQAASQFNSSTTKIDLDHLRPTTKYDQLTETLQSQIADLDTHILTQIQMCNEVSSILPAIASSGSNLPNDVTYVTSKLAEVRVGFENDAEEITQLRDSTVKKDAREAQICFRHIDRLKMPAQYQSSYQGAGNTGAGGEGVYGGSGLSGWWNHPQTLQRSVRSQSGIRSITIPDDDDEKSTSAGPADILSLFDKRTEEFKDTLKTNVELLREIEDFVESVEMKIVQKERELNDERNGTREPEDQVQLLRYVFGAVERSLYDVADKVGGARDGVQELVMASAERRVGGSLDW